MAASSYDLFISYAQEDAPWVEGFLLDALRQAEVKILTEQAFTLGAPRIGEFERAIKESRRTLLVLSPAYLSESYTQFIDLLAQSYGLETATWPVIPLILKPVELPTRLAMLTALDASDPDEWETVIRRLADTLGRPAPQAPAYPDCPYPGMVPFSEAQSARFFGREDEVEEMLARLRLHPFLAVIGPSGSGKSSLVYAGLQPALRKSRLFGKGGWQMISMRPGETPLSSLQALLADRFDGDSAGQHEEGEKLLLIVDQFEEVFTLAGEEALPFQEALEGLIGRPGLYLVLTVRADFYADLMNAPFWDQVQAHRLEIAPLSRQGLRQAILRPAEDAGVFMEAALIERLLTDAAGEPGVLPLIQETLVLLWERIERRFLPLRAYTALVLGRRDYGEVPRTGLQVAIARRGDLTLAELGREERAIARRIFLRLIQFGEGRDDTRRQQPVTALRSAGDNVEQFEQALATLAENRLITLSAGESSEADVRRADISHEALISGWPTLKTWVEERRESEQTRRRLEAKTEEWVRLGEAEGGLLDEFELLEAENWLASPDAQELGHSERLAQLAQNSRQRLDSVRNRELNQAKQLANTQRQRSQVLTIGLIVSAVLIAVVLYLFGQSNRNLAAAREQERIARTGELAALALSQREENLPLALLLGIEAFRSIDNPQTRNAFYETSFHNPELIQFLGGHDGDVRSVAWSPDGQLASGSDDGTIRLWDLESGQPMKVLEGHSREVLGVAWSADGRLASASADQTVIIWDLQQGLPAQVLSGHNNWALNVAWSTSNQVASGSCNELDDDFSCIKGEVILWDLDSGAPGQRLTGHSDDVRSIAWSGNGQLASGSDDGTVIVWDLESQAPMQVFAGHQNWVWALDWSSDGRLASGSCIEFSDDDFSCTAGKIVVWDAQAGEPLQTLVGHTSSLVSLAWSPQDQLVSGSADGSLILWDAEAGEVARSLSGHSSGIWSVAWSPDGKLASGSGDGTLIVWDPEIDLAEEVLSEQRSKISSVAWSAGGRLAFGSDDGEVFVWNPEGAGTVQVLQGHQAKVLAVAWSPDGRLASGSCAQVDRDGFACWMGEIILWDLEGAKPGQSLLGHPNWVRSLAWSPQGRLASGSCAGFTDESSRCGSGELIIWDLQRGQPGQVLSGHKSWIWSVAWSPDGELASGSCAEIQDLACVLGEVAVWDLASGQPEFSLTGHRRRIRSVSWSTSDLLATGSDDGTVLLWDVSQREIAQTLEGRAARVWTVSWSAGGRLAAGLDDGRIIIWESDGDQMIEVQTLEGHAGAVLSVAWSGQGTIASSSEDGQIRLWEMQPESWLQRSCQRAGRNLTQAEWSQYLSWKGPFDPEYRTCSQWSSTQ